MSVQGVFKPRPQSKSAVGLLLIAEIESRVNEWLTDYQRKVQNPNIV